MKGAKSNGKSDIVRTAGQPTSSSRRVAQDTPSVVTAGQRGTGVEERRVGSERAGVRSASPLEPDTPSQSALERRKAQIVDNVMAIIMEWLDKTIPLQEGDGANRSRGSNGGRGKGGGGGCNSGRHDDPGEDKENQDGKKSNKRQQRDESPDGNDAGGDGRRGGNAPKRARKDGGDRVRKFACPFYKHDPSKCTKSRACAHPGFPSIHRLKEHIYRTHRISKHICARCTKDFTNDKALSAHLRDDDRCEKVDVMPAYGINDAQEEAIRARPGKGKGSDEERWIEIYKLIFPDALDIPTPYYEEQPSMIGIQQYIRNEMPPLIRRELEEEVERKFNYVEDHMKRVAADLVQKFACRLIQSYPGNKEDKDTSDLRATSRSPSRTPDEIYRDPPQPPSDPTPAVPLYENPGDIFRFDLEEFVRDNVSNDQLGYTDFDSLGVNSFWQDPSASFL